jgi:hypothetical protein
MEMWNATPAEDWMEVHCNRKPKNVQADLDIKCHIHEALATVRPR